jgi:hypothetical protein
MAPSSSSSTNDRNNAAIVAERAKSLFCFREDIAPGLRSEMDLKKIFVSTQSEFQKIEVIDTYFGKVSRKREHPQRRSGDLQRVKLYFSLSHVSLSQHVGKTDASHRWQDAKR